MEVKTVATVLGIKKFKGTVEGTDYDSCTLYVEEPFAKDNANAKGSAVIEYKAGKSSVFDSLAHNPFPLQAELVLEISATGKGGQKTTVLAVRPIAPGKPQRAA